MASKKLIAKNTLALYVRMAVTMVVGLYTSRVVLNVLGVEDYGISGVVGGVVSMFGFLNATMSGATSRFISFELGKGDKDRLSKTFATALHAHIFIALIVVVLAETVGLWFLMNKMVIPADRMNAAMWVYQLSILSVCFSFTQVPYDASIIAHEKMDVYAYMEILNVVLRLLIVFLLQVLTGDKLIIYAILGLSVSILIMMLYRLYCLRHFPETHYHFVWDLSIMKPLLSFSGWDLFANFSGIARQHVVNIIINMFFGPLLNAASSIATSVSGIIMQFATNISVALKPQIIKSYAQGKYDETVSLVNIGYIIFFVLLSLVSVPLMCEMHYVLLIWLKLVPDYAVSFCQLLLLFNIFSSPSHAILPAVHATGNIKLPSIVMGSLYILVIPITYFSFKFGARLPWLPYLVNVIAVFLGMLSNALQLSRCIKQFSYLVFLRNIVLKIVLPLACFIGLTYYVSTLYEESFIRLIMTTCFSTCLILTTAYFYLIPKKYRAIVVDYIKDKICKKV